MSDCGSGGLALLTQPLATNSRVPSALNSGTLRNEYLVGFFILDHHVLCEELSSLYTLGEF